MSAQFLQMKMNGIQRRGPTGGWCSLRALDLGSIWGRAFVSSRPSLACLHCKDFPSLLVSCLARRTQTKGGGTRPSSMHFIHVRIQRL